MSHGGILFFDPMVVNESQISAKDFGGNQVKPVRREKKDGSRHRSAVCQPTCG
jgi:hypothetical protein